MSRVPLLGLLLVLPLFTCPAQPAHGGLDGLLSTARARGDALGRDEFAGLASALPLYRQALEAMRDRPAEATAVAETTLHQLWERVAGGTLSASALYSPMFCFGIENTQEMGTEVLFEVWIEDGSRARTRLFAGRAIDAFPAFHALDLQAWSGRTVVLELRTHPGENIRGDRAQWWEPVIAAGDPMRLRLSRVARGEVIDRLVARLREAETFIELYGQRQPLGRGALWGQENNRINAYPPTRGCVGWTVGRFSVQVPHTGGLAYPLSLLALPETAVAEAFPR